MFVGGGWVPTLNTERDWPRNFYICDKGTSPSSTSELGRVQLNPAGHCPPALSIFVSLSLQTYRQPWLSQHGRGKQGRSQLRALEGPRMKLCQGNSPCRKNEGRWRPIIPGVLNSTGHPCLFTLGKGLGAGARWNSLCVSAGSRTDRAGGWMDFPVTLINCQKVTVWVKQHWSAPQISHP